MPHLLWAFDEDGASLVLKGDFVSRVEGDAGHAVAARGAGERDHFQTGPRLIELQSDAIECVFEVLDLEGQRHHLRGAGAHRLEHQARIGPFREEDENRLTDEGAAESLQAFQCIAIPK